MLADETVSWLRIKHQISQVAKQWHMPVSWCKPVACKQYPVLPLQNVNSLSPRQCHRYCHYTQPSSHSQNTHERVIHVTWYMHGYTETTRQSVFMSQIISMSSSFSECIAIVGNTGVSICNTNWPTSLTDSGMAYFCDVVRRVLNLVERNTGWLLFLIIKITPVSSLWLPLADITRQ